MRDGREPILNQQGIHCGYKGEMYSYLEGA